MQRKVNVVEDLDGNKTCWGRKTLFIRPCKHKKRNELPA